LAAKNVKTKWNKFPVLSSKVYLSGTARSSVGYKCRICPIRSVVERQVLGNPAVYAATCPVCSTCPDLVEVARFQVSDGGYVAVKGAAHLVTAKQSQKHGSKSAGSDTLI